MPPGQILRAHRLVAQKKTAHGAPWTKEDVRELRAHSKARTPLLEIATKMKRTERALRRKAGILGIGLGNRRGLGGRFVLGIASILTGALSALVFDWNNAA